MIADLAPAVQRAVLDYLLNCAWQAPLVAAATLSLAKLAGLSVRARCAAFIGAMAVAAVAPTLQLHLPAAVGDLGAAAALPSHVGGAVRAPIGRWAATGLVAVALVAIGLAAVRLAIAWTAARRLVRRSTPLRLPPDIARRMGAFTARFGCAAPQIRTCEGVAGPAVVGAWSPVVLIPPGFERLPEEQVVAALLHECAHVVRRDYALNLLCEALALPSSWHPAAHMLKLRYRAARELVCDQLAAAEMGSPARYARCLVELARTVSDARRGLSGPALHLLGRRDLEDRVRELLRPAGGLQPVGVGAALAIAVSCVVSLAWLHVTPVLDDGDHLREIARVPTFSRVLSAPPPSPRLASLIAAPVRAVRVLGGRRFRHAGLRPAAFVRLARATPTPTEASVPAGLGPPPPEVVQIGAAGGVPGRIFLVRALDLPAPTCFGPSAAIATPTSQDAPGPAPAAAPDLVEPSTVAPPQGAGGSSTRPISTPTLSPPMQALPSLTCLKSASIRSAAAGGLA